MKFKSLAVLFAFAFSASSAMADNLYVVGSAGQAKVKDFQGPLDNDLRSAGATSLSSLADDTDTAYKLQLGYKVNQNFAVEGGYFNLGKSSYNATYTGGAANASFKVDGWNLSAVGTLPFNEQFSLFGKLGAAFNTVKANATAIGAGGSASGSAKDNEVGAVYGVGANFSLTKQIALRAEYEIYDKVGGDDTGKSKVDVWSLGIAYKF